MQKRICNVLNRPYPSFLACRKGSIYYSWLIIIMMIIANIVQPFGLHNWDEFYKSLVIITYTGLFFGMYALLYCTLSYFRPEYYQPDTWTVKKECRTLLLFIPLTACSTFLFAGFTAPGFKPDLPYFIHLQQYNILLSGLSIPSFGFFVHARLNPITLAKRRKRKEKKASLLTQEGQQAHDVLQKLHDAMETRQLYLSPKCTKHYISEHTGIAPHRISGTINTYTDGTFTDFVNKYRVEHACRIIQNSKNKRPKLEAVGLDCGFGSKVNFYTAFRKFKGKTPKEYVAGM